MIRSMNKADLDTVIKIWFTANISAHAFIPAEYWKKHYASVKEMISQAEVYVWENEEGIQGFVGLSGDYIAGIFVCEETRSRGIGKELLDFVKESRRNLTLHVYAKNKRAVRFYKRENFTVLSEQTDKATGEKEYSMTWQTEKIRKIQKREKGDCGKDAVKAKNVQE